MSRQIEIDNTGHVLRIIAGDGTVEYAAPDQEPKSTDLYKRIDALLLELLPLVCVKGDEANREAFFQEAAKEEVAQFLREVYPRSTPEREPKADEGLRERCKSRAREILDGICGNEGVGFTSTAYLSEQLGQFVISEIERSKR